MTAPRIAFCTTCKGRTQHLRQTLSRNISDNAEYPNCVFVVLDYGSPDDMRAYLTSEHRADMDSGRLVVYNFPAAGRFRMAHAKNMAHRLGIREGAAILVNLDADNLTGPGFAGYVRACFHTDQDSLLWARWNQPGMEPGTRIPKGCCGRIAVPASAFLKSGGYDEAKFDTWGPDDKDFHFRVRRLGYEPRVIAREYLDAILHTDKMRFRDYPEAKGTTGDYQISEFGDDIQPIANYGDFGKGTVFRNYGCDPIRLRPLPTRIFGIGMHKTATTSLHHALQVLGFDSAHWKSVAWARRIWEEMSAAGRSHTLERHYALSDLPIAILYQELDKAYPGSKFILTTRDEEKWVRSAEAHWSRANGFINTWVKEQAFAQRLHSIVYGQPNFDREIFLARYRRHNAEVREYFSGRPGDLLVMNMDEGAGWAELCGFLDQSAPAGSYPTSFITPA